MLDSLNEIMGPHIFPQRADGGDPRTCPSCGNGQLSLKLSRFGAFVGCSNYPECKFTRQLSASANAEASGVGGEGGGPRNLGKDPATDLDVTVRDGRFGPYVQLGEGEKPKRQSLPKGMPVESLDLDTALVLLSLPREVAKHPESGEPILAGIGRYGPYVQHGKTYANIGKDDDILAIGGNRAIDLIITKESGGGFQRAGAVAGRVLGDHPAGGPITVHAGRFGPYVKHGSVNATIPKSLSADTITIPQAVELLTAREAAGGGKKKPAARKAAAKPAAGKPAVKKAAAKKKAPAKKAVGKAKPKAAE